MQWGAEYKASGHDWVKKWLTTMVIISKKWLTTMVIISDDVGDAYGWAGSVCVPDHLLSWLEGLGGHIHTFIVICIPYFG